MSKACIIVPCYNEELRLEVEPFLDFADGHPDIHFLFVDDGSKDQTTNVLAKLCKQSNQLNYITLEENVGKAEAVRKGILKCSENYSIVGYLDADLATPLEEMIRLLHIFESRNTKFLLASRVKRLGTKINRKPLRHILGRIFATLTSLLVELPVYDSQCGAKWINSEVALTIFKEPFISKWLFDVELLFRMKKYLPSDVPNILEVPLYYWIEKGESKIKFTDTFNFPIELLRIALKYKS